MVMPGETLKTGAPLVCQTCGVKAILGVQQSAAGWYIGTWCGCGVYTRESGYYPNQEAAQRALDREDWER